jgi:rRNA maturation protein Rpf1
MRPIWLGEPGGASDEGTVRIELHGGDEEVVVSERRGNPHRLEIVEVVRERHQSDS